MPDYNQNKCQQLVNQFWHNYLSVLEKHSIPVKVRKTILAHDVEIL